jgi:hypothetical protein
MKVLAGVAARVSIGGRIAATNLSAGLAHSQVHPLTADLQALLAAGDVTRGLEDLDFVEVTAGSHQLLLRRRGNDSSSWESFTVCVVYVTPGTFLAIIAAAAVAGTFSALASGRGVVVPVVVIELLLGGFAAGVITRQLLKTRELPAFDSKLNAVAFGVLKMVLFFVLFLVVRGTPTTAALPRRARQARAHRAGADERDSAAARPGDHDPGDRHRAHARLDRRGARWSCSSLDARLSRPRPAAAGGSRRSGRRDCSRGPRGAKAADF